MVISGNADELILYVFKRAFLMYSKTLKLRPDF